MARPPRIPNRLPRNHATIYFLTLCVQDRLPVLANDLCWKACLEALERLDKWQIIATLMMPDHIHILASPRDRESSVSNLSKWFKRWFNQGIEPSWKWQPGIFDRLLRNDRMANEKWLYIQENPVRRGLVKHAADWPYKMMNVLS